MGGTLTDDRIKVIALFDDFCLCLLPLNRFQLYLATLDASPLLQSEQGWLHRA